MWGLGFRIAGTKAHRSRYDSEGYGQSWWKQKNINSSQLLSKLLTGACIGDYTGQSYRAY